jgi:hypothetical protein
VIPLKVRAIPPMSIATQRALAVVSTLIKSFSTRLEPLSMKLANSVPLMDCLLGCVASPALPLYLDEFSFRFNNRDAFSMMDRVLATYS